LQDRELIAAFLERQTEAVQLVDTWVRVAAASFRFRLNLHWEDTIQDTHIKILQALRGEKFRGERGLKTYIWKLTNNTCIDQIRRMAGKTFASLETIVDRQDEGIDPLEGISRQEDTHRLLTLLQNTPTQCKQLWGMILEGQGYQEMSQSLAISESTLRVRVHRCRQKAVALRGKSTNHEELSHVL